MNKFDNSGTKNLYSINVAKKDTLVFSIALNGYQWLYPEHLASHKSYADKNNYDHVLITKPVISKLGMECCWLKLTLMKTALENGYKNVMFVDADAYINNSCPPVKSIFQKEKYLYMAFGYTERFNTGVMIARYSSELIYWLDNVIDCRNQDIPTIDSTGWGENGHIIHFSKQVDFIVQLHHRWNNTFDSNLQDHIRHFSNGPMRSSKLKSFAHYVLRRVSSLFAKYSLKVQLKSACQNNDLLRQEATKVANIYPQFKA